MKGRPRSFATEDVLEKAMIVFWRHGYEGASLGRLQAATGLTPPSIYNAFGSKEGLYEACLDHYAGSVGARNMAALSRPASRAGCSGVPAGGGTRVHPRRAAAGVHDLDGVPEPVTRADVGGRGDGVTTYRDVGPAHRVPDGGRGP